MNSYQVQAITASSVRLIWLGSFCTASTDSVNIVTQVGDGGEGRGGDKQRERQTKDRDKDKKGHTERERERERRIQSYILYRI